MSKPDTITINGFTIPRISTHLTFVDYWGGFKARWAINRMQFIVEPGLYAIGDPDQNSPVFVSANYKLSFDALRKNLDGIDSWILVIDTKGINVWCAAGKGSFGTEEIAARVSAVNLNTIVTHRRLITPQLGAPGIAAHEVKRLTGFSIVYGPVRAEDIKAFLENDNTAKPEMRQVRFTLYDRFVLIPVELVGGFKHLLFAAAVMTLLAGIGSGNYLAMVRVQGLPAVLLVGLAYLAGTVGGPLLLPWLPPRSFALKGLITGAIALAIGYAAGWTGTVPLAVIAWALIMLPISSFIVLNFTGASTYTSLSGVYKEMKISLPLQALAIAAGLILWITGNVQ